MERTIMKTVRLITCDDSFQANIIKGALENEGIAAVLHNEHAADVMRGYVREASTVDVLVYECDGERALDILERNGMIPERLRYCPFCHSGNIVYKLKKEHRIRAVLATLAAMLTASSPVSKHGEYVCKDCGAHFSRPAGKGE